MDQGLTKPNGPFHRASWGSDFSQAQTIDARIHNNTNGDVHSHQIQSQPLLTPMYSPYAFGSLDAMAMAAEAVRGSDTAIRQNIFTDARAPKESLMSEQQARWEAALAVAAMSHKELGKFDKTQGRRRGSTLDTENTKIINTNLPASSIFQPIRPSETRVDNAARASETSTTTTSFLSSSPYTARSEINSLVVAQEGGRRRGWTVYGYDRHHADNPLYEQATTRSSSLSKRGGTGNSSNDVGGGKSEGGEGSAKDISSDYSGISISNRENGHSRASGRGERGVRYTLVNSHDRSVDQPDTSKNIFVNNNERDGNPTQNTETLMEMSLQDPRLTEALAITSRFAPAAFGQCNIPPPLTLAMANLPSSVPAYLSGQGNAAVRGGESVLSVTANESASKTFKSSSTLSFAGTTGAGDTSISQSTTGSGPSALENLTGIPGYSWGNSSFDDMASNSLRAYASAYAMRRNFPPWFTPTTVPLVPSSQSVIMAPWMAASAGNPCSQVYSTHQVGPYSSPLFVAPSADQLQNLPHLISVTSPSFVPEHNSVGRGMGAHVSTEVPTGSSSMPQHMPAVLEYMSYFWPVGFPHPS